MLFGCFKPQPACGEAFVHQALEEVDPIKFSDKRQQQVDLSQHAEMFEPEVLQQKTGTETAALLNS